MRHDWLWGVPLESWEAQEEWVRERLAADPIAASISAEEAEDFFAAGYILRALGPMEGRKIWPKFNVRASGKGEKSLRLGVLGVLRRWKNPRAREMMLWLVYNTAFPRCPDPQAQPEAWTEERFRTYFEGGHSIVWLAKIRRYLGKGDDLTEWLKTVGEWAEEKYHMSLNAARIALRRIVYPQAEPHNGVAASAQVAVEEVRAKDQQTGALRQDVRRLERDRKRLRAQARQVEQRARATLSQARGEVAAARKALKERPVAHREELAAQARRLEQEIQVVRSQIAGVRSGFLRSLAEITPRPRRALLWGRSITVTDAQGNEEVCRQLVESLGGTFLPEGGDVEFSASSGMAALERALRNLSLQQVLIKCDGLYRRKEGRYGVAVAGLQVQAGSQTIYQDARVVNCGPLAGSLMAEYGAVLLALTWLLSASPPRGAHVVVWSDCRTLLSRLRRTQGAKRKAGCNSLDAAVRQAVRILRKRGCEVEFRWVPREEVHVVDRLCDSAYRALTWYHKPKVKPQSPLSAFLRTRWQFAESPPG